MLLSEHEALTATHLRLLLFAFVGWLFDYYDLILYTFLTREISDSLGFTKMDHAYALGISFVGTGVGGVACGFLADRFGRRAVIAWTILLYSAGTLLTGCAWDMRTLMVGRVITGVGVGGEWAAGHSLIAETFPPRYRGRAGAILQTGAPVGVLLAVFVGGFLVRWGVSWRVCFQLSAATGLFAFFVRRAMPESDLWLAKRTERFGAGFLSLLRAPALYLGFVLTVVNGTAYWLVYSWLPEYLRKMNEQTFLAFMLVVAFGQLVGYSSFGWVSDRIDRRVSFTLFALVMAAALLPLTIFADKVGAPSLYAATLLVGLGTGTWSNFGPLFSELFPTRTRNTAMASIFNLSRVLMVIPSALVPALAKKHGLGAGIALAAAFSAAASVLVWALPETRGKNLSNE